MDPKKKISLIRNMLNLRWSFNPFLISLSSHPKKKMRNMLNPIKILNKSII